MLVSEVESSSESREFWEALNSPRSPCSPVTNFFSSTPDLAHFSRSNSKLSNDLSRSTSNIDNDLSMSDIVDLERSVNEMKAELERSLSEARENQERSVLERSTSDIQDLERSSPFLELKKRWSSHILDSSEDVANESVQNSKNDDSCDDGRYLVKVNKLKAQWEQRLASSEEG